MAKINIFEKFKAKDMRNTIQKFVTNVWLIAVIMLKDIIEIGKHIYQQFAIKTTFTMETNFDWFEIFIKLFMATALMIVFRKYYEMKKANEEMEKQSTLSRIFNHVLFEEQYRINEIIASDRNKAIEKIKKSFYEKVNQKYKNIMLQTDIEKMANEYFNYNLTLGID